MKKKLCSLLVLVLLAWNHADACTNFMAGKLATIDGSTLVSYAADSYSLYGFLRYQPAADHPAGAMRQIYDWDTNKYLGEIPQVPHTFSVVGNMNEHQLTIAETTFGGRTELVDTTGVMDYGSLIYVALERCRTAREAINCMTSLVRDYGYYSEGESFTIADPNEVWIMEMVGKGVGNKGALWVATRIPDDCVSAHANQARITQIDFRDKDNWLYAEDVVDFAKTKGWFTGKKTDFSFSDTYAPLDFSGLYICEARVWSFFRQVNVGMETYFDYVMGKSEKRMPLFVKPDRKLSAQDFKNLCATSTRVRLWISRKAPMPVPSTQNCAMVLSASNSTRFSIGTNVPRRHSKPHGVSSHRCVVICPTISEVYFGLVSTMPPPTFMSPSIAA